MPTNLHQCLFFFQGEHGKEDANAFILLDEKVGLEDLVMNPEKERCIVETLYKEIQEKCKEKISDIHILNLEFACDIY